MQVFKKGQVPQQDATNAPIFYGGKVTRQSLVGPDKSKYYNFTIVSFSKGAKNKFHTHTSDQVLYVLSGKGIVATEKGEVVVTEGDAILIPAGEKHWHGASDESDFSHISLTSADSKTTIYD